MNSIGVGGSWSSARYFRVRLETPAPAFPISVTVDSLRPVFTWSQISDAASYTIAASIYSNLSYPLFSVTTSGTSYQHTSNLPAAKTIYWRVKANGANPSSWSSIKKFTTPKPPSAPALSSPAKNALVTNYTPTLKWKPSTVPIGAAPLAGYQVQFDDNADFSSTLYDQAGLTTTSFLISAPLTPNTKYYWRVRALNANGEYAAWSSSYFRAAMLAPVLASPLPGATVTTQKPTFSWEAVEGAVSYTITISAYANLSNALLTVTAPKLSYTSTTLLPKNKTLYWSVRANGPNGPSPRSEIRSFKISF